MADFQLKVTAETQDAERKLQQVDKVATEATRDRPIKVEIPNYSQLSKNFGDLKKDINEAANTVKQFYRVAGQLPVGPVKEINEMASQLKNVASAANDTRKNVGDAGDVIRGTLEGAGKAAESLVGRLTRVAFSLYVVNQAVQAVNEAFAGMFKATIGREIQLRETILKTQTTLASTNKVFRNGKEITDPYQKIVSLTGEIGKRIDSIRERSIALAGVTSNDVIEVFGIVASQIGQVGGGLKEAEDLAINFAAALGTFGIPLYQARQEIGSILRGDITMDSYLAKSLGITNKDIADAKTKTGGVVKFLEERLAASVAGQRIAAEGFAGVVSNIKDIQELVSQSFGRGLLDPLLDGLTKIFDFLFKIRQQLLGVSELVGRSIGTVVSGSVGMIAGASGVSKDPGGKAAVLLSATESGVNTISRKITAAIDSVYLQLATLAERANAAFTVITKGLAALAYGLLSIKLEQFKALISVLESVSPALLAAANAVGGLLAAWGQFMQVPIVQFIAQINAGMRVLEATGITQVISSAIILKGIITWVQANIPKLIAHFNSIRAVIGGVIAALGTLIVNTTQAGAAMLAAWQPQSKALQALKAELTQLSAQLNIVGSNAQAAGQKLGGLANTGGKLGGGIVGLIAGMVKFQLIMFAITATISLVTNLFGKWKEAQDRIAADKRADVALQRLRTTYKDLGDDATAAQKRARDFEQAIVDANYAKGVEQLEEVRKKINQIRYELKPGIQSWGEFWDALSGSEVGRFEERNRQILRDLEADEGAITKRLAAVDAAQDRKNAQERIALEANKRKDLEKEIAAFRRSHENEIFQQRQTLAQKEVEIFRAAGELRIFQMEQANKKMIEGEEGASRTALEALNNYLSVRERGELEIESAKQNLAVEVANLERAITNYRYSIEEKIAKLRNDASANEKAAAEARRDATAAGSGPGASGAVPTDVAGRQDKAMAFFMGKGLSRIQAAALVGGLTQESQMSTTAQNPKSGALGLAQWLGDRKTAMLGSGAGANFNKQLDFIWHELLGPENAAYQKLKSAKTLNQALLGAASFERFDGYQSIGAGTEWGDRIGYTNDILRRTPGGAPLRTAAAGQGAVAPAGAAGGGIGDGSRELAEYQTAVRNVASAMERLRLLQAALTNAKTVEAFAAIAKSVFEPVGLEDIQDNLTQVQLTYQALAESSAGAFDPERTKIELDTLIKVKASNRELLQIEESVNAATLLSAEQKKRLIADIGARHAAYLESLHKEQTLQQAILAAQRAVDLVTRFRTETKGVYEEIEATRLRNRLQAEGVSPEVIQAELNKLRIRRELNDAQKQFTDALALESKLRDDLQKQIGGTTDTKERKRLQAELDAALARIRQLEDQLKNLPAEGQKRADAEDARTKEKAEPIQDLMGRWKAELADTKTMVVSLAQTIQSELGSAMSNAVNGVINGTMTVREAFGQMFANIGKAFIDMATQMIAKALILKVLGILFPGAAPGGGGGGGLGGLFGGGAPAAVAGGGIFSGAGPFQFRAAGGPISAGRPYIVGERGPELVFPGSSGYVMPADRTAALAQSRAALSGGSASAGAVNAFSENRDALSTATSMSRERQVERWLTSGASSTEIKYSRVGSGDLPFVTEQDMLQATRIAAQEGAKLGQQRTLAALRNNPATRRSIGV